MFLAALFDLDGTILESLSVWTYIDKVFFSKRGITDYSCFETDTIAMNLKEASLYTKEHFGLDEDPNDIINEWMSLAEREYAEHIPAKPGVVEYIKHLYAKGIKLALATSALPELFKPALTRLGIINLFDEFFTSCDGLTKNTREFYTKCAEILNIKPNECIVFDDALPCIKAAKNCGMQTGCVADSLWEETAVEAIQECDVYVKDFTKLICDKRFS